MSYYNELLIYRKLLMLEVWCLYSKIYNSPIRNAGFFITKFITKQPDRKLI